VAEAQREAGGAEPRRQSRLPDLVLVDGGKGQVSMAREVFAELGLTCRASSAWKRARAARWAWKLVFADGAKVYLGRTRPR
jgi:excinuclease ABC subunit C